MLTDTDHTRAGLDPRPGPARTAADLALIAAAGIAVVAVAAAAPTHLYAYAQLKRIGSAMAILQRGQWLLPINQTGGIASKPQLYPWLSAALLWATGAYNDIVFRLPNIAAYLATAALTYVFARRALGRRVALLAGCLFATALHMGRMAYIASTDMLLTMSITASMLCADRLLARPCPRRDRWKWGVALWASMIVGGLSKGWGVVNLALVGFTLLLVAVIGRPLPVGLHRHRRRGRLALTLWLALRRTRRTMRATYFGWGLLAMAAVFVPLWIGMALRGGAEFRELIYHEFIQRATGVGANPPEGPSAPPVLHWLYYLLPASVPALGALALVRPRRWFRRRGPIGVPLAWTVGVVLPFSLTAGFRPDYLLPCFPAGAMMAAWAVEETRRRGGLDRASAVLRHVIAAASVTVGLAVAVLAAGYLLRGHLGGALADALDPPYRRHAATRAALWVLVPGGLACIVLAVRWSLRWRLGRVAGVAVVGMLGVAFFSTHLLSRHARTGDGEIMRRFALRARPIVGDDGFLVLRAEKLSVELYLGRLGTHVRSLEHLNRTGHPWLITCDRGLCGMGSCRPDPNGAYVAEVFVDTPAGPAERKQRYAIVAEDFGRDVLASEPVFSQNWGRIHLIRLRRPVTVSGTAPRMPFVSGRREDED